MLKRRGVIETTSHVILLILIGGLLAGTLGGPMYSAIKEGFDILDRYTGVSEYQEVENIDQLAGFAHYTWDRAHGCSQVQDTLDDGGYPSLAGTDYTSKPGCSGAPGTLAADLTSNLAGDTGNDMEGRYSRIKFEVTRKIKLVSYQNYGRGSAWAGNSGKKFGFKTVSISGDSFGELAAEDCAGNVMDAPQGEDKDKRGGGPAHPEPSWVGAHLWPVVFTDDVGSSRYNSDIWTWADAKADGHDGSPSIRPYCLENPAGVAGNEFGYMVSTISTRHWTDDQARVVLCPGDKGFVEVRKGFAHNAGEFTEYDWDADLTDIQYFPYIQITSVNQSGCGGLGPEKISGGRPVGHNLVFKSQNEPDNEIADLSHFKLRDNTPGGEMKDCRLSITEWDAAAHDSGYVYFDQGSILPKTAYGEGGGFPTLDGPNTTYTGLSGPFPPDDGGPRTLYNFLQIQGMDGRGVNPNVGEAPILVNPGGGKKLKMYGDLLCYQKDSWSHAKWVSCDESVTWLSDGETVTIPEDNWMGDQELQFSCDMISGLWSAE